jgi:hypothetical protein
MVSVAKLVGILIFAGVCLAIACAGPQVYVQEEPEIDKTYYVSCIRPGGDVIYEGLVEDRPRVDPTLRLLVFTTELGVDYAVPIGYCVSNSVPEEVLAPLTFQAVNLVRGN